MDYAATTPVDPRVAHRMSSCLMMDGNFGNPASSSHVFGWEAEELVEKARVELANLIGADPLEIAWTSGATESDNLAIKGLAEIDERNHIVTSSYEHKAVLDTCQYLEHCGTRVTYVKPDNEGLVHPESIEKAITDDTFVVSVMHVNNEIGVVNDVQSIGEVCRSRDVVFHVDGAQSVGKIPVDVEQMKIDLLSISGHKIYGPKGIGALYIRREPPIRIAAMIHGGGHERGVRSGTLATHQIVGIGAAARICTQELETESARILRLRKRFWSHLQQVPGATLNGSELHRVPGILNVAFDGVQDESLLMALDDVAVSSGSACTSATVEPSYVLRELEIPHELAASSIRFSIGRFTTKEDVDYAARRVSEIVSTLREGTEQFVQ
ncbi:MAG: IscS subfamily cysteine desulfurase [Gammaproteobacteria bacterium]|nr:IscS subfamily cysteine desulfurase [Gammaproteobacteria bacterium]MYD80096.1 IscS subfamily cysteine desulfurase [Gammaproteobacteria bacterium]